LKNPLSGWGMVEVKTYIVYRLDYVTNKKEPIAMLVDRRKNERRNNAEDMMQLAQKLYAESPIGSHLTISPE
jgi:hypothetical protein